MKCKKCKDETFEFCKGKNCKECCKQQGKKYTNNNSIMEEEILYKDILSLKMEDGTVYILSDDEKATLKKIITKTISKGLHLKNILGVSVNKGSRYNTITIVLKKEKNETNNINITKDSQTKIIPGKAAKRKSKNNEKKYPKGK